MLRWSTTTCQPGSTGMYVRPACSIVFTEPPPDMPSSRRTWGSRISAAIASDASRLAEIDASFEPPRTVKSSPESTIGRSSSSAIPNTKFDGVNSTRLP